MYSIKITLSNQFRTVSLIHFYIPLQIDGFLLLEFIRGLHPKVVTHAKETK